MVDTDGSIGNKSHANRQFFGISYLCLLPFVYGVYSIVMAYVKLIKPLLKNEIMVESDIAMKKRWT